MAELSVFIDESGEFGTNSDYYLLTLVFHEQDKDISSQVKRLDSVMDAAKLPNDKPIHTAPLIRKEDDYFHLELETRRQIFDKLFTFTRTVDIKYVTFSYRKREYPENQELINRITRDMAIFFRDNLEYFQKFDSITTYYDGGQFEITKIISIVFAVNFFDVDPRKAQPKDYRLLQSADLLCYLELLARKDAAKGLSKSEVLFFEGRRRLVRTYLKTVWKMRF